jgi:hypothetical protein
MRTSTKLLIALALIPASLPLMALSGWFGLGVPVGLVLSILWGIDYAAELRERPALAWPQRLAMLVLSSLQALFALLVLACGLAILAWVGWNLLVERQPAFEWRASSLALPFVMVLIGAGWLWQTFTHRQRRAGEPPRVLHFHSDLFPALPHEDEFLNPGILGRALADWITERLRGGPFEVRERVDEDFGWCLEVRPPPRLLWVGVSGACDLAWPDGGLDEAMAARIPPDAIAWTLQVCIETVGWRTLSPDDPLHAEADALLRALRDALEATGRVRWVA